MNPWADTHDSRRRVKCDQSKPYCLNCVAAGRECHGYRSRNSQHLLTSTSYSIPFRIPGSQRDRQLLHYFCVSAAVDISGISSLDFWSRVVLQVSQDDHTVRQALIALSSLHLGLVQNVNGSPVISKEALNLYGQSMRALQRRIGLSKSVGDKKATGSALICSVLFYCFECILGNSYSATEHLDNGLHLLSFQLESSEENDSSGFLHEHTQSLFTIMSRLDTQATIFNDSRIPRLRLVSKGRHARFSDLDSKMSLSSIEESHSHFTILQNWLFHLLMDTTDTERSLYTIPNEVLEEKELLLVALDRWQQMLQRLITSEIATHTSITASEVIALAAQVLFVQYHTLRMVLLSRFPRDESVFSAVPNTAAMQILELAECTLQLSRIVRAANVNDCTVFSSETGIIAPLFYLAMKCRDKVVRRKAVELLAMCDSREGIFNAPSMVKIIQDIGMLAEEKGDFVELGMARELEGQSLEWWALQELMLDKDVGSIDCLIKYIEQWKS